MSITHSVMEGAEPATQTWVGQVASAIGGGLIAVAARAVHALKWRRRMERRFSEMEETLRRIENSAVSTATRVANVQAGMAEAKADQTARMDRIENRVDHLGQKAGG